MSRTVGSGHAIEAEETAMLLRVWIALIAVAVAFAPAYAQEPIGIVSVVSAGPCTDDATVGGGAGRPFGFFDGHPHGQNAVTGSLPLSGWALDDDGIAAVDILVDGFVVARAQYGENRPGIETLYPSFPDAEAPGFGHVLDTTWFLNGDHVLSAQAISNVGEVTQLNAVRIQFSNNTHNLAPFGFIEFPNNNAELFGNCNLSSSNRRYSVISGWALDAGVEVNDHGVGYVELLLDGTILFSSKRDCVHSTVTGAYTNCYGLRRQDVEEVFPSLKDAANAGFRFVLDVGLLMSGFGYTPGHHWIIIRSGDIDSQVANIDSIQVNFVCEDFFGNPGSFGSIDGPPVGLQDDITQITGWALDAQGVGSVRIHVDGLFNGVATYGFPYAGITSLYPGYPDSLAPGWVYELDTTALSDGPHVVSAVVIDDLGADTFIGDHTIEVLNP
jgi:N-acetylmuramoyl-L-alanine amidase